MNFQSINLFNSFFLLLLQVWTEFDIVEMFIPGISTPLFSDIDIFTLPSSRRKTNLRGMLKRRRDGRILELQGIRMIDMTMSKCLFIHEINE